MSKYLQFSNWHTLHIVLAFLTFSLTPIVYAEQNCGTSTGGDPCNQFSPVASTSQNNKVADSAGNPINIITGNKFQLESDYKTSGGLASLVLNRFYSSLNTIHDLGLGYGWRHSFDMYLNASEDQSTVQVTQSDGRRVLFKRQGVNSTTFNGLSPQDGVINLVNGKPIWSLNDGRQITFRAGLPIEIRYLGNKVFTLKYFKGHIRLITDYQGRRLVFNYSEGKTAMGSFAEPEDTDVKLSGHLESVVLPSGESITYSYDADHNLSKVTYPDGTSRIYHYENIGFPNYLTGITDRSGKRIATYGYTEEGRANLSQGANGTDKIVLEYRIPEQFGDVGTTILTNSQGQKNTYTWRYHEKISQALLLSSEGPGCSTCPLPHRSYTYNNQYQIKTATDTKTGKVTQYDYDKLGRTEKISFDSAQEPSFGTVQETGKLIARYEYTGNSPRPTLVARPSINPGKEHITKIKYNSDLLPISFIEQGFEPASDKTRNITIEYKNGRVGSVDLVEDQKNQTTQIEYDDQGRLQKHLLPNGQELVILKRDNAGRPSKIQLSSVNHQSSNIYTFKYNWEGKPTEIAEGNRKIVMEYDLGVSSKTLKTTIYLPEKENNISSSKVVDSIVGSLIQTANAEAPTTTSITGVYKQNKGIETVLEFNEVHRMLQSAESATLQSYLPASTTSNITPIGQCTSNHVKCAELERGLKYFELTNCSYVPTECIGHGEWDYLTADDLGVDNELMFTGRYAAIVLKNKKTGEYVLSFQGTEDITDWWDNIGQGGLGATTGQYEKAIELAIILEDKYPNLTITGHSLGGGLATAAALAIDKEAVVFNPAGLHPDFIKENGLNVNKADELVTNYTINGEILSTLQDKGPIYIPTLPIGFKKFDAPSALGTRITLEPDDRWIYQEIGFTLPIEHAIKKGTLLHGREAIKNTLLHQQSELGCNSSP